MAVSDWEYGVATEPFGNVVGEMVKTPIVKDLVVVFAVGVALSVTLMTNVDEPAVVGVPDNTPAADSVKPAGNVPEFNVHVREPVPPVAANVWEYAVAGEETPPGSGDAVVMVSCACRPVALAIMRIRTGSSFLNIFV